MKIKNEYLIPYDATNSSNPYLLNKKESGLLIGPDNVPMTAEYIWSKSGKDRDDLVEWVFQYYRKNGFPKLQANEDEMRRVFKTISGRKVDDILNANNEIVNSNSYGSDIIKHFAGELFYSTTGQSKGSSCVEVFNDDVLLKKVLRNRMGYHTSSEDGKERPYVFSISDSMIIQGMRSSALGFATSQFKPMVAKYIYKNYCPDNGKVLDYSAGWGARALAAGSCNIGYFGIDPLTYDKVNKMIDFFKINGKVVQGGSEDPAMYAGTDFDLAFSSPPFFDLEVYSSDPSQSYVKFNEYNTWLSGYWENTVKNCHSVLKKDGFFILSMVESLGKLNLAKDMNGICSKYFTLDKTINVKVARNHLSGKRQSKQVSKTTEKFYVFKKS